MQRKTYRNERRDICTVTTGCANDRECNCTGRTKWPPGSTATCPSPERKWEIRPNNTRSQVDLTGMYRTLLTTEYTFFPKLHGILCSRNYVKNQITYQYV